MDQNTDDPQTNLMNLNDTCSYTIEGKRYTCDKSSSFGRGIAGADLDCASRTWDEDYAQYHIEFTLTKSQDENSSDDGYLNGSFIKKYGTNQLTKTWPIGIAGPET